MDILIYNSKIEVKKSPIHGYGIFAKENIKKDEILEECHFISIGGTSLSEEDKAFLSKNDLGKYMFRFPRNTMQEIAWVLGIGSIYNSSPKPNADWETNEKRRLFIFKSIKNIQKGEEILINYQNHLEWCKRVNLI